MEDFEKKLSLDEQMEEDRKTDSSNTLSLLRQFLEIQQRRAEAYSKLKRYYWFWFSISFSFEILIAVLQKKWRIRSFELYVCV